MPADILLLALDSRIQLGSSCVDSSPTCSSLLEILRSMQKTCRSLSECVLGLAVVPSFKRLPTNKTFVGQLSVKPGFPHLALEAG